MPAHLSCTLISSLIPNGILIGPKLTTHWNNKSNYAGAAQDWDYIAYTGPGFLNQVISLFAATTNGLFPAAHPRYHLEWRIVCLTPEVYYCLLCTRHLLTSYHYYLDTTTLPGCHQVTCHQFDLHTFHIYSTSNERRHALVHDVCQDSGGPSRCPRWWEAATRPQHCFCPEALVRRRRAKDLITRRI